MNSVISCSWLTVNELHSALSSSVQLLEAETVQHIFSNNYQLCTEISESVLQHFIHCLATHGRHVQYLNFLHTIIKAEGKYVKKCQDMIMTEVSAGTEEEEEARPQCCV